MILTLSFKNKTTQIDGTKALKKIIPNHDNDDDKGENNYDGEIVIVT